MRVRARGQGFLGVEGMEVWNGGWMAIAEKKPDIRELVGVAVNTSALVTTRGEGALDRIAAMGAAALEISLGADLANLPIAAMEGAVYRRSADMRDVMLDPGTPDERDQVIGELAPMLWHIRYGGQHGMLAQSIMLYTRWLSGRRQFASVETAILSRFAARILHEWLSDKCVVCGGSGRLEKTRTGDLIRGTGRMARNAVFVPCRTKRGGCSGTGRSKPSPVERARWLGLDRATYDAQRWDQRFGAGQSMLKSLIVRRLHRPLTGQLERRKKQI